MNVSSVELRAIYFASLVVTTYLQYQNAVIAVCEVVPDFGLVRHVAKELIHKLKFEHARAAAIPITALMQMHFDLPQTAVLTHVPTATGRVRQRGYDQSALVVRQLARNTGLPYASLLTRLGQQRQVGKNRVERHAQMGELFLVAQKQVPNQVVLVDDVITTGATLEACARKLKEAGAQQVLAVVFAAA